MFEGTGEVVSESCLPCRVIVIMSDIESTGKSQHGLYLPEKLGSPGDVPRAQSAINALGDQEIVEEVYACGLRRLEGLGHSFITSLEIVRHPPVIKCLKTMKVKERQGMRAVRK